MNTSQEGQGGQGGQNPQNQAFQVNQANVTPSGSMGVGQAQGSVVAYQPTMSTAGIQKLNGENYLPWRRQVSIVLKLRGLSSAIECEGVAEHVDLQAILILLDAMDDGHRLQVQAEATAYAIMKNLDRQYANRSLATKHRLLSNFVRHSKSPSDTLNQHVGKLKELRAALANLGERFTEDFFQVVLINSLTSEFGNILEQWEMMHPSMKTTEFLLNMLQQRDESAKDCSSLTLVHKTKDWKSMSIEERKRVSNCKRRRLHNLVLKQSI